MPPRRNKN